MPKQQWEEDAENRFLQFLSATANETWAVLDRDVVVDPATNRNFDYRLGLGERRIALELFRLVKDEAELARERVWSEVVHALERELTERSVKGYQREQTNFFSKRVVWSHIFIGSHEAARCGRPMSIGRGQSNNFLRANFRF